MPAPHIEPASFTSSSSAPNGSSKAALNPFPNNAYSNSTCPSSPTEMRFTVAKGNVAPSPPNGYASHPPAATEQPGVSAHSTTERAQRAADRSVSSEANLTIAPIPFSQKAHEKLAATHSRIRGSQFPDPSPTRFLTAESALLSSPPPPRTGSDRRSEVGLQELKNELNEESHGSISLSVIAERIACQAFELLQNLGETLVSAGYDQRRKRVFDTAIDLRKEFIKLYVLIRWSRSARHLQHLRNITGLVHEQSYQTLDSREDLANTRSLLPNARLRNLDVATAVEMLSSRCKVLLPEGGGLRGIAPQSLTNAESRTIIRQLNEAIRLRLHCGEALPVRLQAATYHVSDGRAHLSVRDLFNITLTLSGASPDDRWYLLAITFDFNVTGPGREVFPQKLHGTQRESFLSTANLMLDPTREDAKLLDSPLSLASETLCETRPLFRFFYFLESQALEYQLDILAFQFLQLSRTRKLGSLNLKWNQRTLSVTYWYRESDDTSASTHKASTAQGGCIEFAVKRLDGATFPSLRTQSKAIQRQDSRTSPATNQESPPLRLCVKWLPHESAHFLTTKTLDACSGHVDSRNLSAENIVDEITQQHARHALSALRKRIHEWNAGCLSTEEKISKIGTLIAITLRLHETLHVSVSIDTRSGRLSLASIVGERSGTSTSDGLSLQPVYNRCSTWQWANGQLQEATDRLLAEPDSIIEVLSKLQISAIQHDIIRKACYLGLRCQRFPALASGELAKLAAAQADLVFLPLERCPDHYLVFVSRRTGELDAAIIQLGFPLMSDSVPVGPSLIQTLKWLSPLKMISGGLAFGADNDSKRHSKAMRSLPSLQDLQRLFRYAVTVTLSSHLESQMLLRAIPFIYWPRGTQIGHGISSQSEDLVSTMLAKSAFIFGPTAPGLLHENVALSLRKCWSKNDFSVQLLARMKCSVTLALNPESHISRAAPKGQHVSVTIQADKSGQELLFEVRTLADALELFQFQWNLLAPLASLAWLLQRRLPNNLKEHAKRPSLRHYDLNSLSFVYGNGSMRCTLRRRSWTARSAPSERAQLELLLGVERGPLLGSVKSLGSPSTASRIPEARNPHELIHHLLTDRIATTNREIPDWSHMLGLLESTLPVLEVLQHLSQQGDPFRQSRGIEVQILDCDWYQVIIDEICNLDIRLMRGRRVCISSSATTDEEAVPSAPASGLPVSEYDSIRPVPHNTSLSMASLARRALGDLTAPHEGNAAAALRDCVIILDNSAVCSVESDEAQKATKEFLQRLIELAESQVV